MRRNMHLELVLRSSLQSNCGSHMAATTVLDLVLGLKYPYRGSHMAATKHFLPKSIYSDLL